MGEGAKKLEARYSSGSRGRRCDGCMGGKRVRNTRGDLRVCRKARTAKRRPDGRAEADGIVVPLSGRRPERAGIKET